MRVNHLTHCPDDLMVIALLLDPMMAAAVSGFHLPIAGSALCPEGTHSEVGVGPENQKLKKHIFLDQKSQSKKSKANTSTDSFHAGLLLGKVTSLTRKERYSWHCFH